MAAFETPEGQSMRDSFGMKHYQALSMADDPNLIVVLSGFDTAEALATFVKSDELKQAMESSGVTQMEPSIPCGKTLIEIEND